MVWEDRYVRHFITTCVVYDRVLNCQTLDGDERNGVRSVVGTLIVIGVKRLLLLFRIVLPQGGGLPVVTRVSVSTLSESRDRVRQWKREETRCKPPTDYGTSNRQRQYSITTTTDSNLKNGDSLPVTSLRTGTDPPSVSVGSWTSGTGRTWVRVIDQV